MDPAEYKTALAHWITQHRETLEQSIEEGTTAIARQSPDPAISQAQTVVDEMMKDAKTLLKPSKQPYHVDPPPRVFVLSDKSKALVTNERGYVTATTVLPRSIEMTERQIRVPLEELKAVMAAKCGQVALGITQLNTLANPERAAKAMEAAPLLGAIFHGKPEEYARALDSHLERVNPAAAGDMCSVEKMNPHRWAKLLKTHGALTDKGLDAGKALELFEKELDKLNFKVLATGRKPT
jgi:hypothetical protein